MALLNIFSEAVAPTGFWSWLILTVFSFVENYGWRIVLFTFCLKIALSPIDIYQRYKGRKNQLIMLKIKPQMDKLQKMYESDPRLLAQKQTELSRKSGISYFSSCLPAIITLVIFITLLYSGLQPISKYQNFRQYERLYGKYTEFCNDELIEERYSQLYPDLYNGKLDEAKANESDIRAAEIEKLKEETGEAAYDGVMAEKTDDMSADELKALEARAAQAKTAALEAFRADDYTSEIDKRTSEAVIKAAEDAVRKVAEDELKEKAQSEVFKEYDENVKMDFLWVKNVWNADVMWTAPINNASQFKSNIGEYGTDYKKAGLDSADELAEMLSEYDNVMAKLLNDPEYNKNNGFMVLPILTVLLSVVMQILSFRQQKESGQMNAQSESTSKIMMFVMPVMMGWFSFSYTAAFAIYLVMNYVVSILISVLSTLVIKIVDKKNENNLVNAVQSYGRPDFSDRKTEPAKKTNNKNNSKKE